MSFVRLFGDHQTGWQMRGQYAIWTGAGEASKYLLLERVGDRVAPITYGDARPVFHEIKAGTPFHVQGMAGYWLAFDSDAMWLDTPAPEGQYAVLAVGGSAGKPSRAIVDWTCTRCGAGIGPHAIEIGPQGFRRFLDEADRYASEVSRDPTLRTCRKCDAVHPPVPGLIREPADAATEASEV
jgi:hypothetical protein